MGLPHYLLRVAEPGFEPGRNSNTPLNHSASCFPLGPSDHPPHLVETQRGPPLLHHHAWLPRTLRARPSSILTWHQKPCPALPCTGTTGACVRPHRLLEGSPPSRGPPALSRALEIESHHQLKLADLNQIPAGDKKRVVSRANDRAWSPLEEERTAEAGRTEMVTHECPANRICNEG